MLDKLACKAFYCCLDGYFGYLQIPIARRDQEKTTFTCPYGTFAYRRMSFELCNTPATFQRCMMSILFIYLIESCIEILMDDVSIFGTCFDTWLHNLNVVLKRCRDTRLVLNLENFQFMVKKSIVLGLKLSHVVIEVDLAKVE